MRFTNLRFMISAIISMANNYLDTLPVKNKTKQWVLKELKKRLKIAYNHPKVLQYVVELYNNTELIKDVVDVLLMKKYIAKGRAIKKYRPHKVIHLKF